MNMEPSCKERRIRAICIGGNVVVKKGQLLVEPEGAISVSNAKVKVACESGLTDGVARLPTDMVNKEALDSILLASGDGPPGREGPRGSDLLLATHGTYEPRLCPLAGVESVCLGLGPSSESQDYMTCLGRTSFVALVHATVSPAILEKDKAQDPKMIMFAMDLPVRPRDSRTVGFVVPSGRILHGEARVDNDSGMAIVTAHLGIEPDVAPHEETIDLIIGFSYKCMRDARTTAKTAEE
ncbi:hypothetical protein ml_75 [Mollivirus sibericum]|uniref:hypothetical protein n=1 Tax=Mollivirus sibericum TaxID=1678078 RepID=UPI0006B2E95F|nr:hypothetical protein ml_75 [Mollivirus sibericum]ALD61877.1 hypothetical protein ml_75 [Mollivirus sibericum]